MEWEDMLKAFEATSRLNSRRSIGSSLITGLSGILGNVIQGVFNTKQVRETNKVNRELVDIQNQAAKEESELAYKRSLPQNQVANLMSAGMSRAGAINTLNGGGSYQPAPVAVSENEAPQIDVSQALNAIQASVQMAEQKRQFELQRKHEEKIQQEQLKAQREQQAAQHKHEQLLKDVDTSNLTQGQYLDYEKHKERLDFDKKVYQDAAPLRKRQLEELDARISNLNAQTNNTKVQTSLYDLEYELSAEDLDVKKIRILADNLASISQSQLEILFNESKSNAIKTLDPAELNNYMQYKMRMELVSLIATAIKEQEWSGPNRDKALNYLKLVENLVIRK